MMIATRRVGGRRDMATSVPCPVRRPRGRRVRRVTVIVGGAGIAGLACARELVDGGVPVRVLERARVGGGRLARIRVRRRYADIGAGYPTPAQPGFPGRRESV